MALPEDLHNVAIGLLRNVPKPELNSLIDMIEIFNAQKKDDALAALNMIYNIINGSSARDITGLIRTVRYFNEKCQESSRADCLQYGCKKPDSVEQKLREVLVEKSASQNFYMQTTTPVCKCCGR